MAQPKVTLDDLQLLDLQELREALPPGSVEESEDDAAGDQYGDFGVAVVVILTTAAINALSVWLAKKRKSDVFEEDLTYSAGPNGVHVTLHRKGSSQSSEPPDAAVVKALKLKLSEVASVAAQTGG
jgi:hypothetical protein